MYPVQSWCHWRPEEGIKSLGLESQISMSCRGVLGTKLGAPKEQQVFLTAELSLQLPGKVFF